MNYCNKVDSEGLLIRLVDRELESNQADDVLKHLRSCPSCLAKMAGALLTDYELKGAFNPQELADAVAQQAEEAAVNLESRGGDLLNERRDAKVAKTIQVRDLPIGSILEYDLYDSDGTLLVTSKSSLTHGTIDSLIRRGITEVTVRAPVRRHDSSLTREAMALKTVPDRGFYTALAKGGAPLNISVVSKQLALDALRQAFAKIGSNISIDVEDVRETCDDIVDDLMGDEVISPSIIDMYLTDSSMYHHSINVMVIFTSVCSALGMPISTVKSYAAGSMLHDIGKVFLRKAVNDKGGRQIDIDRAHPEAGFKYLSGLPSTEGAVANVVRNHHERYDGGGFPRGVKGEELGVIGQILILANFYDNNTWDHKQGIKTGFDLAVDSIIEQSNTLVEAQIVNAFLNVFGHYPPGSWIVLNSGEAGMVVQATPFKPRSPVIHVYIDDSGERLAEAIPLDLSQPGMPYVTGRYTDG